MAKREAQRSNCKDQQTNHAEVQDNNHETFPVAKRMYLT